MADYYCEYCGTKSHSVASLTNNYCPRHPDGRRGRHKLYEGSKKSQYTCKYCGTKMHTIANLTNNSCPRHPDGSHKGRHSPAL